MMRCVEQEERVTEDALFSWQHIASVKTTTVLFQNMIRIEPLNLAAYGLLSHISNTCKVVTLTSRHWSFIFATWPLTFSPTQDSYRLYMYIKLHIIKAA